MFSENISTVEQKTPLFKHDFVLHGYIVDSERALLDETKSLILDVSKRIRLWAMCNIRTIDVDNVGCAVSDQI